MLEMVDMVVMVDILVMLDMLDFMDVVDMDKTVMNPLKQNQPNNIYI